MTQDDIEERVAELQSQVDDNASVSQDVLIDQTGWLVAHQTLLSVLLLHLLRLSDDPEIILNQIQFDARSIIRNKTNFVGNSQESADRYRQKAEEKLDQFLHDISGKQ
ncbi:MAG: hypothetical protein WDZ83_09775 [Rhizobiaceae bacterium]